MAANLQGLPVEILSEICSYLCSHCPSGHQQQSETDSLYQGDLETPDPHALSALCLTSRLLNSVATPYLYHYIHLEGNRANVPILPLLRTLVERPDLSNHVRWIEIDGVQDLSAVDDWVATERLFYEAALRYNMALAPDWYRDESSFLSPEFDAQEVFIELLLLLPRNLEKIEFGVRNGWQFRRLGTAADPSRPPPSLPALNVLSISSVDRLYESGLYPVKNLQTVMRLAPQLHTLVVTHCSYSPEQPCPGIARIKNLYLADSSMPRDQLDQIVAAHTGLETFEAFLNPLDEDFVFMFSVCDLVHALKKHHAKSLRRLSLVLTQGSHTVQLPGHGVADTIQSMDSLRAFTNLERLKLYEYNPGVLRELDLPVDGALIDLLPQKNLRELYFPDASIFELEELLKALASRIESENQFPGLREVHVLFYPDIENWEGAPPEEEIEEMARTFCSRFSALGVDLIPVPERI